jgi:hypothetical protein
MVAALRSIAVAPKISCWMVAVSLSPFGKDVPG